MSDSIPCSCSGPGYCSRLGSVVSVNTYKACKNNSSFILVEEEISLITKPEDIKTLPRKTRKKYKTNKNILISGPGTELKEILSSLGFSSSGCGCNNRAREMNGWGIEGCIKNKEIILTWLRSQQKKRGWLETIKAGVLAITTGLAFNIDPLDPAPGILEEALRRAEAKLAPKEPG